MTAELRLSGRAAGERLRGTLHAGLAAPASSRFEAVAPFGQPFFILAGRDNRASLLLPRENRILPDAAVPEILDRLIGLRLSAQDMRLLLTGCLAEGATPEEPRRWPDGWRAVSLPARTSTAAPTTESRPAGESRPDGTITAYLKDVAGVPAVVAADYGEWRVDYGGHQNGWPRSVRIRSTAGNAIDLTAAVDQIELNTGIDDRAFVVTAPAGARPMALDELRSIAPLRPRD